MSYRPETFGDPAGEYESAHKGGGFVGEALSLTWAVGRDSVSYLQGVLSQDIESIAPGRVARSFLLQPRGKLEALLWVLRAEDRVGLVTDADHRDGLISNLSRWRLRVDTEFEPDPREVFAVWGPSAGFLDAPDGWRDDRGVLVARLRELPIRYLLVAGIDGAAMEAAGLRPIGGQAATTLRIEAGEPRMGVDVDRRTIPQESGLVPEAVSFDKGCFLGQELVARIDSRGRVNRNLRGVRVLSSAVPPVGARVIHKTKTVGVLTSVGESRRVGAPVALALIRREAPPGTRVVITWEEGEFPGRIERLPFLNT